MELIAVPGIWLGGSERALRAAPVLLAMVFFWLIGVVGKKMGGSNVAAIALLAVAADGPIQRFSSDLLSDIPSSAVLVFVAWLVFFELSRDGGPSPRLIWAGPLAAVSIYLRYGSCIYLAIILALALPSIRAIRAQPVTALATVGAFIVGMLPHFVHALSLYGVPWGTLTISATVPPSAADQFPKYLSHPLTMFGWPVLVLLPLAVRAGLRFRLARMLLLTAVFGTAALGLKTLGQPRYVFVSSAIVIILGAAELSRLLDTLAARAQRRVTGGLLLSVGIGLGSQLWAATAYKPTRRAGMRDTLIAAEAIRAAHEPMQCFVLGRHQTQLEWYGGCTATLWAQDPRLSRSVVYVVTDDTGGPDQPDPGAVAALPGAHEAVVHVGTHVDVVRIVPTAH